MIESYHIVIFSNYAMKKENKIRSLVSHRVVIAFIAFLPAEVYGSQGRVVESSIPDDVNISI